MEDWENVNPASDAVANQSHVLVRARLNLQRALDVGGGAGAAVGALVLRRRSDQADDVQKPFGLEWFCHTDDCAELMAGGIIGGLCGSRKQNDRHVLQAIVAFDDQAEIVAAHVLAFHFREETDRHGGAQNFERFLSCGHDDHGVAVLTKNIAHDIGSALIGFDREHN